MSYRDICPLCGGKNCKRVSLEGDWSYDLEGFYLVCDEGIQCSIHSDMFLGTNEEIKKRFHMVYAFLLNRKRLNRNKTIRYNFYYQESTKTDDVEDLRYVNVARLMLNYPEEFMDKMDLAILNLSRKYPVYGQQIYSGYELINSLLCDIEIDGASDTNGVMNILKDLGYVNNIDNDNSKFVISAEGWKHVADMDKKDVSKQGFMAMSFSEETRKISDTFKEAILKCGYEARRIDEKEHNNQIVPEILYEIKKSRFVVVDITYPNYGAYYEAGYAEALGKQVIICCRKEEFNGKNKPHFDIAQKSAVIWEDEKDLEQRLIRRIEATVGKNN